MLQHWWRGNKEKSPLKVLEESIQWEFQQKNIKRKFKNDIESSSWQPKFKSSCLNISFTQPYHRVSWYLMNISSHYIHSNSVEKSFSLYVCLSSRYYNVRPPNDRTFMRMDWKECSFIFVSLTFIFKWTDYDGRRKN